MHAELDRVANEIERVTEGCSRLHLQSELMSANMCDAGIRNIWINDMFNESTQPEKILAPNGLSCLGCDRC